MNNIILNLFISLIEYICGVPEKNEEIKSYDNYFLYDLETFEITSLYE